MVNDLNYYLNLITSENRNKPDFVAMVTLNTAVARRVQELLTAMIPLFDLDVAVGQQLDVIGQWVGITRNVSIPIDGVYFTWDGTYEVGWDFGTWRPTDAPTSVTSLPDDAYRTLIRAKIAANQWDGTTEGAYEIWDAVFPEFTILIQDNQNMTYAMAIIGGIIDSLTLALITGGYLPLKPEGVRISEYYISIDANPIFAWDIENTRLAGWDEGSWVRIIEPT
jgi:hypothetical protein